MIVAISYHNGDLPLMIRWANHVAKLGTYQNHSIIIAPVHDAFTEEVEEIVRPAFGKFHIQPCFHTESGWPISCNKAFENVATYIELKEKQPFLWMEPDAVPLKSSWIDDIQADYNKNKKPFMGDFVGIRGVMPNGVDHMSGIAVYPWNLSHYAPSIFRNENIAWDIASGREVVPQMARTKLIQHDWVPTEKWRRDKVTPDLVNPLAVVYHPDKLGVLFKDGLSPNGAGGDLQTGIPCEGSPHETKETKLSQGTPESVETAIKNAINVLLFHSKIDEKNKRKISKWLIEANLTKAKSSKQSGKKVRSSVGKRGRPKTGSGVPIPPNSEVAV